MFFVAVTRTAPFTNSTPALTVRLSTATSSAGCKRTATSSNFSGMAKSNHQPAKAKHEITVPCALSGSREALVEGVWSGGKPIRQFSLGAHQQNAGLRRQRRRTVKTLY